MRASRFTLVVALVAFALAGCATASLPAGLTDAQVQEIFDAENRAWWEAIAPGEPLPEIDVVEYVVDGGPDLVAQCLDEQQIDGLVTTRDGSLTFPNPEVMNQFERATFVCVQEHPYRADGTAESMGLYSPAQLDYLLVYFTERLIPCLTAQGYRVAAAPPALVGPYIPWSPYDGMSPHPSSPSEWARVDLRCPPPSIGAFHRSGDW